PPAKGGSTSADAENPAATERAESLFDAKQAPGTQDTVRHEAVRAQQAVIRQMRERLKALPGGRKKQHPPLTRTAAENPDDARHSVVSRLTKPDRAPVAPVLSSASAQRGHQRDSGARGNARIAVQGHGPPDEAEEQPAAAVTTELPDYLPARML